MKAAKQSRFGGVLDARDGRDRFREAAIALADIGADFYSRGWMLGTGGNFSAVLNVDPLRVAITPSGSDKGSLSSSDILEINSAGEVIIGNDRPSFECTLHLAILDVRRAGAVLHTHSVWATILSTWEIARGGLAIEGYEMLKGLEGIGSHLHREWIPILPNSQDMMQLASIVKSTLNDNPNAHGFLLQGHGLYSWGQTLTIAKRHVEVLEFLLEVVGRSYGRTPSSIATM